jgi:hypothetical protein
MRWRLATSCSCVNGIAFSGVVAYRALHARTESRRVARCGSAPGSNALYRNPLAYRSRCTRLKAAPADYLPGVCEVARRVLRHGPPSGSSPRAGCARHMKRTKKAAPKSGFVVHEDHRFHARPRGQTVLRRANGPRKPRNWAGPRSSPTASRGGCGWSANEGGPAKRAAREAALKSSNAGQRRSHEAQNAAPNDAEEQDPSDERGLHARLLIWCRQ